MTNLYVVAKTPRPSGLSADRCGTPAWTPVTPRSRPSPVMSACGATTPTVTAMTSSASPFTGQENCVLTTNNVVVQSDAKLNIPCVNTMTPSNDVTGRLNETITLDDGVSILPMPSSDATLQRSSMSRGIDTATVTKSRPILAETMNKPNIVRSMDFTGVNSPSLCGEFLLLKICVSHNFATHYFSYEIFKDISKSVRLPSMSSFLWTKFNFLKFMITITGLNKVNHTTI